MARIGKSYFTERKKVNALNPEAPVRHGLLDPEGQRGAFNNNVRTDLQPLLIFPQTKLVI